MRKIKRLRLPRKRERFAEWKVHKHIEEPNVTTFNEQGESLRSCGSSIAHGHCVYAGEIADGVPMCDARHRIWVGCPCASVHVQRPLIETRPTDREFLRGKRL